MTGTRLVLRTVVHYWRTSLAVTLGIAVAVAVLAGALLVGDSVRGSLRDIALGRLGRTGHVVSSAGFFREALAADLAAATRAGSAPLVVAGGAVTLERSGRRAAGVQIYGVDARFWQFHGLPAPSGPALSPALAAELDARPGDVLLVRMQKPSAIPMESLFGRKDDVGRTVRLDVAQTLGREGLGEFALTPQQTEVRAVFAPLALVQRDLDIGATVNTVLLGTEAGPQALDAAVDAALASSVTLDDLGAAVTVAVHPPALVIESGNGIVGEALEASAKTAGAALGLEPVPVFTYLATTIRRGDRGIPYSLVTATDLETVAPSRAPQGGWTADSMLLNEWAAADLGAAAGDAIDLEYLLWDPAAGLTTATKRFRVAGIVPITGFAADRRLAPRYPGVTEAVSLADWNPPFPVDLSRIRPRDEDYWRQHRTTPKAFIPFAAGQALWRSRYGSATSIRFRVPAGADSEITAASLRTALRKDLPAAAAGLSVMPARRLAEEASGGTTDFGEYFTYFSFFIVASAVMLSVLFFRLGVEQRLRQVGILRSAGFTSGHIRRLLVAESLVTATAGSLLGAAGGIAYAALVIHALRTWWVGAVGTTLLAVHVRPASLLVGAAAGIIVSVVSVVLSLRAVARLSPRALLTAQGLDRSAGSPRPHRAPRAGIAFAAAGAAMLGGGFFSRQAQAGLFFGAGAALLVAAMLLWSWWLRGRDTRSLPPAGSWPMWRMGVRGAAFRPARSVLSATLIASAAFIIVSVDAFRKGAPADAGDVHSGTGGFALLGESEVPLLFSPNEETGWESLGLGSRPALAVGAQFTRFRLRRGDDTSCLNLYRPTNPTLIAPEPAFLERGRFAFAGSLAESDSERRNPWLLLQRSSSTTVPVIVDATSLQYVLHASLGDTMTIEDDGGRAIVLQFVATLADSVLQSELVMSEENFVRLFPAQQGYRFFLVDTPRAGPAAAGELAQVLEREMASYGLDVVSTTERLEAFHRVENTYLSTFQALGGLGLVLGTVGLGAIMFRNVLERRRELAMLRAIGFNAGRIGAMMMAETTLLLGAGLAAGAGAAVLAVAPAWLGRSGARPGAGLAILLLCVCAGGLLSALLATRAALSGNVLESLRAE